MKYRNVRTGRELERPAADKWLEASAGWERIDATADDIAAAELDLELGRTVPVEELLDADDLAVIAAEDDDERTDTE